MSQSKASIVAKLAPQQQAEFTISKSNIGAMGIQIFQKSRFQNASDLVYLTILNDEHSYGKGRQFQDFIDLLVNQSATASFPSVGLLISGKSELDLVSLFIQANFEKLPFSKLTLIHYPEESVTNRENRKADHLQKDRRRRLAMLRNTLSFIALQGEQHVIWIDGDIVGIPSELSQKMINSGKDVVVPSCYLKDGNYDYDLNSWVGQRTHPSPEEIEGIKNGKLYVPRHAGAKFITDLRAKNQEFVEIDSVGGTMLYSRAELFRQGVNFPPLYIVGTDWDRREGWDGIETEGLCFIAKAMGYKCWAMPFEVIWHTNEK